jgi:hypothetical protein
LKVGSEELEVSFGGVLLVGVDTPSDGDIGLTERWVLFLDPGPSFTSIVVRVYGTEWLLLLEEQLLEGLLCLGTQ